MNGARGQKRGNAPELGRVGVSLFPMTRAGQGVPWVRRGFHACRARAEKDNWEGSGFLPSFPNLPSLPLSPKSHPAVSLGSPRRGGSAPPPSWTPQPIIPSPSSLAAGADGARREPGEGWGGLSPPEGARLQKAARPFPRLSMGGKKSAFAASFPFSSSALQLSG